MHNVISLHELDRFHNVISLDGIYHKLIEYLVGLHFEINTLLTCYKGNLMNQDLFHGAIVTFTTS